MLPITREPTIWKPLVIPKPCPSRWLCKQQSEETTSLVKPSDSGFQQPFQGSKSHNNIKRGRKESTFKSHLKVTSSTQVPHPSFLPNQEFNPHDSWQTVLILIKDLIWDLLRNIPIFIKCQLYTRHWITCNSLNQKIELCVHILMALKNWSLFNPRQVITVLKIFLKA